MTETGSMTYSTSKIISDGTIHLYKQLKTYMKRPNDKRTKHKVRKGVRKWVESTLQTSPEEQIKIINEITAKLMATNEEYHKLSREHGLKRKEYLARKERVRKEAKAKKDTKKGDGKTPDEVVAILGDDKISVTGGKNGQPGPRG